MIIPLTNNPNEGFNAVINGINYIFHQKWSKNDYWVLDIKTDSFTVSGIKIVPNINLLFYYTYIPFSLVCNFPTIPGRFDLESVEMEVILNV